MAKDEVLVEVKNLFKYFPISGGVFGRTVANVKAVDGVSFIIRKGEALGLVGESGSGKTTVGRTLLRLIEPTKGKITYDGVDITTISRAKLRPMRKHMQIIFQDPFGSLNPRMTVGEMLGEPMEIHGVAHGRDKDHRIQDLLELVGLRGEHARRYPHEFSGGQRQRVGIARALALNPAFIVADEPVSALDVSIQAQIINLLIDLQSRLNLTFLFIAHDLGVVKRMCDTVAVMYLGNIMEHAENTKLFGQPLHPYTQALLSAVPIPDPDIKRERIILRGDIPSPVNPPPGCKFHTRCQNFISGLCDVKIPELREVRPLHLVACHLV
ncbi:MAG: Oligopeptide transport ATP-binding protein OppF [candidate division WS2 bacterium]|uniref:Oligopeptide transport ATP-binding protein OppF n=1 Tax=Psychracetigena formicireducens TaxID=2986056 RepID=A0A9E2BHV5_PSYF1|nr:Oligopeptide transport ATP-binding protein OppF [Candidatus Psychracetigena formicireducens]MBT9144861.1 Oligopeptide transport ATP-binding protein OppF [Candidatus Psychracetigena formicireducens]MBT9150308.1 Oligopeptide transport ATP-binding protein OppF [Candidatus Psychracetigena formicireducens]